MTKTKVVRIFTWITVLVQVVVGVWGLISMRNTSGQEYYFLDILLYGFLADMFVVLPIAIVSILFMIGDKGNRKAYIPDLAIQLVVSPLVLPYVFFILTEFFEP